MLISCSAPAGGERGSCEPDGLRLTPDCADAPAAWPSPSPSRGSLHRRRNGDTKLPGSLCWHLLCRRGHCWKDSPVGGGHGCIFLASWRPLSCRPVAGCLGPVPLPARLGPLARWKEGAAKFAGLCLCSSRVAPPLSAAVGPKLHGSGPQFPAAVKWVFWFTALMQLASPVPTASLSLSPFA